MHHRVKNSKEPLYDMRAHLQENIEPMVSDFDAFADGIEIEQTNGEAGGKTDEGDAGQ